MARYFIHLAYDGTSYAGWQRQPNAMTVQQHLEEVMTLYYQEPIQIYGCGRTDAGVHASSFYAHVNVNGAVVANDLYRLNKMLNEDVAIYEIKQVSDDAHARFDAHRRGYVYQISCSKSPFLRNDHYHFPFCKKLDIDLLHKVSQLYLDYDSFYPFCKTNSDANHYLCTMYQSEWKVSQDTMYFHVSANRFLRGMVRLMVGASLNVARGKLPIEELQRCLTDQKRLPLDWSVPAKGLYLVDVQYPFLDG